MRVRVVDDIAAAATDGRLHQDLVPGKIYEVLSVADGFFRLSGESDDPVLYPPEILKIVDPTIPKGWIFEMINLDLPESKLRPPWFMLGPPEFLVPGFWERYHDGRSDAIEIYEEVKKRYE